MSSLIQIQEPSNKGKPTPPSWNAFLELGFRPLYLAASAWAFTAIALWIFLPHLLFTPIPSVYWHAHEMLWGFIGTVAVGFLLTATNNWTGVNPLKGRALAGLWLLWIAARIALLIPHEKALLSALIFNGLFYAVAAGAVTRCVVKQRNRQNYALPLLMLGMGLASAFYLGSFYQNTEHSAVLQKYATGMLCMATITALLARRVIPFFASRAIQDLDIDRHTRTGQWQTGLSALAIVCWILNWQQAAGTLLLIVALIAIWHLIAWRFWAVRKHPLLWILYAGYAGLALGLAAMAAYCFGWITVFAIPIHTLGVLGFSVLIIGMITRTALGHLGLPLRVDQSIFYCYVMMIAAAILRVSALIGPRFASSLITLSAALWMATFAIYIYRFFHLLIRPRADARPGKPIEIKRS